MKVTEVFIKKISLCRVVVEVLIMKYRMFSLLFIHRCISQTIKGMRKGSKGHLKYFHELSEE